MIRKPALRVTAAALLIGGLLLSRITGDSEVAIAGIPLPPPPPAFEIRWHQGQLELSGHTQSVQHEQELLALVESSYGSAIVSTHFQPLGVVPKNWSDVTAQILYLLAETASSTASVSADKIDIRGVTTESLGWQSRLAAVEKSLPAGIFVSADTLLVDPSISVATVCARAFENFDAGAINFEESSDDFRSSAYPRLQRVISLARACPNSRVAITGHTDASGTEAWNQKLSLKRANAVGDYLARGGIDTARLLISGQGSAEPIADNATRYGRSLNRRIEIVLQP